MENKEPQIWSNAKFKSVARQLQIEFRKDPEIAVPAKPETEAELDEITPNYPVLHIIRNEKETTVLVKSSLLWDDAKDDLGFRIFYSGFRKEITEEIYAVRKNKPDMSIGPMVTNLLRSEHIPYNVFFPMTMDLTGAGNLFNNILGFERISSVSEISIEYNPGTLSDGTAFDVFVKYNTSDNKIGGIGIEVKYTEKEYHLKKTDKNGRITKEYKETHDENDGIRLAENYKIPSINSGWFKSEFIEDIHASAITRGHKPKHVVNDDYRQIWRNHLLGASMVLSNDTETHLDEFTSLTVFPEGNGHFSAKRSKTGKTLWKEYNEMLTTEGQATIKDLTFEKLFPLMRKYLRNVPKIDEWIDYLERRYINFKPQKS
jgi:hypothetical protein